MECVSVHMCEGPGDSKVLRGATFTVMSNTRLTCDIFYRQHYINIYIFDYTE